MVTSWLQDVGLGEYSHMFIKNDIRGAELITLQKSDLKVRCEAISRLWAS